MQIIGAQLYALFLSNLINFKTDSFDQLLGLCFNQLGVREDSEVIAT